MGVEKRRAVQVIGRQPLRLDLMYRQQARRTLLLETMDVETRLLSDVEQCVFTKIGEGAGLGREGFSA